MVWRKRVFLFPLFICGLCLCITRDGEGVARTRRGTIIKPVFVMVFSWGAASPLFGVYLLFIHEHKFIVHFLRFVLYCFLHPLSFFVLIALY